MVTGCLSVGRINDSDIFRINAATLLSLRGDPRDEERIVEVRRLLNSGTLYFSWSSTSGGQFDLSLCAQRCMQSHDTDNRFFWLVIFKFVYFTLFC